MRSRRGLPGRTWGRGAAVSGSRAVEAAAPCIRRRWGLLPGLCSPCPPNITIGCLPPQGTGADTCNSSGHRRQQPWAATAQHELQATQPHAQPHSAVAAVGEQTTRLRSWQSAVQGNRSPIDGGRWPMDSSSGVGPYGPAADIHSNTSSPSPTLHCQCNKRFGALVMMVPRIQQRSAGFNSPGASLVLGYSPCACLVSRMYHWCILSLLCASLVFRMHLCCIFKSENIAWPHLCFESESLVL